jgi:ABC-type Fe3+/spermidine/putrescine transport system ATPase subunit
MTPSLELRDVVRDYGKGARVGPVSFTADPGLFVSLLGPSGCGKTTLLRCIAGFEPVDDGTLIIDGHSVADIPAHRRGIGLVFQSYALFPHLTVAENVAFGLRLRRVPRAERGKRIEAALQTVGLAHLADRLPSQLSGGQQQRVAIARSIVLEPSIMLLDEPLSNLDYKLRLQMRKELHSLQRRLGMTFVFVTHDQSEALALSDRIIVLSAGKVEQIGTPAEVYRKPRSYFVADFIGGSNLLKAAAIESKGADGALVTLTTGDRFHAGAANSTERGFRSVRKISSWPTTRSLAPTPWSASRSRASSPATASRSRSPWRTHRRGRRRSHSMRLLISHSRRPCAFAPRPAPPFSSVAGRDHASCQAGVAVPTLLRGYRDLPVRARAQPGAGELP